MIRPQVLGAFALIAFGSLRVDAAEAIAETPLKPFNVTVRVFEPTKGMNSGHDYVLLVDSPDAEHAASSTMANAVSFTKKIEGRKAVSVAFTRQGRTALNRPAALHWA